MLRWLERRLGWLAIPNVTLFLICGQLLTFLVCVADPNLWEEIILIPRAVMAGEVWRLLTFLFLAPVLNPAHPVISGFTVLFFLIYLQLLWLFGNAMEQHWGTLRYNLFLLVGYIATVAVGFLFPDHPIGNRFIYTTLFLAFAYLYPDFTMLLFFILPMRVKWLALLTWGLLGFGFIWGTVPTRAAILASVANFLLFFGADLCRRIAYGGRRMKRKVGAIAEAREPFHRCVVCGRTDQTDPQLEFRYARTSEGVKCFCTDHLPPAVTATPNEPAGGLQR